MAKAAEINQSIVHRFMTGQRGLKIDNIVALLKALGKELKLVNRKDRP